MVTNESLNEALKNMGKDSPYGDAKIIGLDDTIKFNCKRCGKCCSGRSDIIINPFDVYQIAKTLNITTKEVIENYCEVYCGNNSCLPIVVLKEDERGLCPFLKFFPDQGKFGCSINDSKPGACIMHPIGIVRSFDKTNNKNDKQFIEVPSCDVHGTDVEVKVKDFIKPYLDNEECHEAGSILMFEPTKYVNSRKFIKGFVDRDEDSMKEYFTEDKINLIKSIGDFITQASYMTYMSSTISSLYDFDINKGFMEQLDEVKDRIKENCMKMVSTFALLGLNFCSEDLTEENVLEIKDTIDKLEKEYEEFCKNEEQVKDAIDTMNGFEKKLEESKEEN